MQMDPEELPNVTAFQDEFTREFMFSVEPVEEGYYLFQSKTGGYTMMYPENARINNLNYNNPGETYELVQLAENDEEKDYQYYIRLRYDASSRAERIESLKDLLSSHVNYDGEYDPFEYKDKTIHFASTEHVNKNGENIAYVFFAV